MVSVSIAGSTGSIGTQALEVIREAPDSFNVNALGAWSSIELLASQVKEFRPEVVAIGDESKYQDLKSLLGNVCEVRAGSEGLSSIASMSDITLNAVVGFKGLEVTVATLEASKRLALANKESLVAGAPVVNRVKMAKGGEIIPVDSEHSAIFQCLKSGGSKEVSKLIITGSGGPFRGKTLSELGEVSLEEALNHPTWKMGPKITVDSSTLMNKGLEVIEAHELFGFDYDAIEVVIHKQSIVHSLVSFIDGATIAQISYPSMKLPISYALCHPERHKVPYGMVNLAEVGQLDFEAPDLNTFKSLSLAYEAGRLGKSMPTVLNAANEIAVDCFLNKKLAWLKIPEVIERTMEASELVEMSEIKHVLEVDFLARKTAREIISTDFF
ncbi:MAG: 1-deoxy-D-xylulose-5-phosphate reductoisomerase [Acidimicrobiales bacterium]|nr:1-deoxy-D-xylulose-5-phosphate reductoisomerase [Acidimicrobiales bacterium]